MLGTGILGATAGAIGVFATLRKQTLLGDAISHAALPGIAIAFLYSPQKTVFPLLIGGACTGTLATALTLYIAKKTTIKTDTLLGIMLSVFFGIGLVLITIIQQQEHTHAAIINNFIFGNASTILVSDLIYLSAIALLVLTCLTIWFKECALTTFDPSFAHTTGHRVIFFDVLLTTLLLCTIIIGLQMVGVILMSALIIAPAAAARQWTHHLHIMALLSATIGGTCGIIGSLISNSFDHIPTGPTIVICLSVIVLLSCLSTTQKAQL